MYTGLRISDILSLKWVDILDKENIVITEKKTGKIRKISINPILKETVSRLSSKINRFDPEQYIFLNKYGKKMAIDQNKMNRKWK